VIKLKDTTFSISNTQVLLPLKTFWLKIGEHVGRTCPAVGAGRGWYQ
jgi:hypothetical protein